ncbi:hypothetical protein Bca4012_071980 [Brassica carinata]|uniref:Uncharacterized protein n=1 Tax=Brassica oleracea var. oleracea TaxID=109376 RepID=A0A0D3CEH3_BRAOL
MSKSKAKKKSKATIQVELFLQTFLAIFTRAEYGSVLQSRFEDPAMLPFRIVSVNHDHREEPSLSSSRFEDSTMLSFRLVSVNHGHREDPSLSSESRLL